MADFAGVDVSEINQLAADLTKAGLLAGVKAYGVAEEYARGTQADARQFAPHGPYTKQYPASITSDVTITPTAIVAEVGPDKDRPQGALGNLLEYGTGKQAPQAHLGPAHDRNLPKAVKRLGDIGAEIL
ncbi:MAG: hypothetical protein JWN67_5036 [Actinomycetia bacterium]|nr:hypothetical protein [Actinomycetes bacterium]